MLTEVINDQSLDEAVSKHISTSDLFNYELPIGNQLSNIMVLDVNMLYPGLIFRVFGNNDASFIIFV